MTKRESGAVADRARAPSSTEIDNKYFIDPFHKATGVDGELRESITQFEAAARNGVCSTTYEEPTPQADIDEMTKI